MRVALNADEGHTKDFERSHLGHKIRFAKLHGESPFKYDEKLKGKASKGRENNKYFFFDKNFISLFFHFLLVSTPKLHFCAPAAFELARTKP